MKNFLFLFITISLLSACGGGNGSTLPNGYTYVKHTNNAGDKPVAGQVVSLDFELRKPDGEVLENSRNPNQTPSVRIPDELDDGMKRNPMLAMLMFMTAGDSATVKVPVDSIPTLPQDYKDEPYVDYVIKVHAIEEEAAYTARMKGDETKKRAAAKFKEEAAAKNIVPLFADYQGGKYKGDTQTLPSGLKVTILEKSDGAKPINGDKVSVQYYGFLKDGTNFDNSFKAGRAFQFEVGKGMVIKGWDEGLLHIPEGAKAMLEIPFDLAYGDTGNAVIPAKSDLYFYIELEKIN